MYTFSRHHPFDGLQLRLEDHRVLPEPVFILTGIHVEWIVLHKVRGFGFDLLTRKYKDINVLIL